MNGFRRGPLAAGMGFALVAAAVLGTMTWATISTVELAKRNVADESRTRMSKAVWRMDSYMGGILNEEMRRPFTDYLPYFTDVPLTAWSVGRPSDINVNRVLLKSELLEPGPPHAWIDFYFQVDEDGNWSSPQHPGHSSPWPIPASALARSAKVCDSLEELAAVLPLVELSDSVAQARLRDDVRADSEDKAISQAVKIATHTHAVAQPRHSRLGTEFHQRGRSKRDAQLRSRPEGQCVNPSHGQEDVADIVTTNRQTDDNAQLASVGVYGDTWATFWLDGTANENSRLVFARTAFKDANVFYQGFIADWSQLKPELLTKISGMFSDSDLHPTSDDVPPDPELGDITMNTIPVELSIPELGAGATAAMAWKSVRGVLFASWAAAAAVLVVAGIGFRNLIALTERRMQFAYAVTHELRTPLTTFRLYADMLSAGLVPEEKRQEYFDTLNRESLRLSSLVEGVLEYARLENHRVRLNVRDTTAESLLTLIAEGLEENCARLGIEPRTRNDVMNGVPLRTDVDVVNQIVGVLINNACRHARGADEPFVLVRLAHEDSRIQIDVIDTGSGIENRDARTIFKPFRRGHGADTAAQGGIGLGLALARSWATLLGGRLDLIARRHRDHGGAHFQLSIPARLDP